MLSPSLVALAAALLSAGCIVKVDESPGPRPQAPPPPPPSPAPPAAAPGPNAPPPMVALPPMPSLSAASPPQHPFLAETSAGQPGGPPSVPTSWAAGTAPALQPGAGPFVVVWLDPDGVFHLRLIAGRGRHRFAARVASYPGGLTGLSAAGLAGRIPPALLRTPRGDLALFADIHDDGRGVDFSVARGSCAHLDVFIDGRADPERILLGPFARHPPGAVFQICP